MQWDLRPFLIPWALVAAALLWLSAIIYSRQKASQVGRLFCLVLLEAGIWFAAFLVMFATTSDEVASVAARVGMAVVALLPASVYEFTTTALRISERRRNTIAVIRVAAFSIAALILLTSTIFDAMPYRYGWGFYPKFTPVGGVLFAGFFAVTFAVHLIDGWLEYHRTREPGRRRRVGQLIAGFLIVYVAVLDLRAMFGSGAQPISYIPLAAFIAFAWPSIRRHRFAPITAARAAEDILETMADALFVLDRDGRIRVLNGAVTTLFGYPPSELMGRTFDYLDGSGAERSLVEDLHHRLEYGVLRDHEGVIRHRDGYGIAVSISASALHDVESAGGSVVIVRDIRARKRDEAEMLIFTERLQQSNRELEDFAHVASHDLQEPLRKIQAFGDRLVKRYGESIPPEGRDYLERMQRAAERMQRLINDLLSFSRITTKAHPFVEVDLTTIVREVLHDLEISIAERGGKVDCEQLPTVEADALQMRQLFQNLIGNALKFSREGVAPHVTVTGSSEGEFVVLQVRDNGIGFEPRYAERIFTIFERLHGRGVYEGTGIGLAICRKIVERHHGTIRADSAPGEGTMFTIQLPVRQSMKGIR